MEHEEEEPEGIMRHINKMFYTLNLTFNLINLSDILIAVEPLTDIDGVVGITLSPQTKLFFEIDDEEMLNSDKQVHKWLSWKKIKLHIFSNGEQSEFFQYYDIIKVFFL